MAAFTPRNKLSKKRKKAQDALGRVTWKFSPVTRTIRSGKIYSRKKRSRDTEEFDTRDLSCSSSGNGSADRPVPGSSV